MRLLSPLLLLGAAAVGRVAAAAAADNDDGPPPTTFNGVEVPPMMELTPENFVDEIESNKYMLIKHYRWVEPRRVRG
jgi:protein disulfide-isomerase